MLNRTPGSLLQEFYEDMLSRREQLQAELRFANAHRAADIHRALAHIAEVMEERIETGAVMTGDPTVDAWEAALARGEEPDFGDPPASAPGGRK